ncbi:MAG: TIGR03936 family radical SAM-associated protein [Clostridia bacterium]|nr:TIGR03936 family radical SAM-associated protein [Clostridia bacterium]
MLVLKYEKTGRACFISHIDLLKHTARTIRRAEIPVKFSNGYSPHALLFFSAPLALGVSSKAEYLAIDADMSKDELLARYNASCAEGLKASKVFECEKNPNLQGKIVCCDYVFPTAYRPIDLSNGFEIEYAKKGEIVKEEVSGKIFGAFDVDGKLVLRLATGNTNLRPDRLLPTLNDMFGEDMSTTSIVKVAQYFKQEDGLVEADEYLKILETGV